MLDDLKFVSNKDPHDELGVIEREWRDRSEEHALAAKQWRADSLTKENLAKQVAEYLAGKSVVIYAQNDETAHVWYENIALRANARVFAVTVTENVEAEISAWRSQPVDKIFGVLLVKTPLDSEVAKQSFAEMERQLSGLWPHPMSIEIGEGVNTFLAELSSAYLAILHSASPTKQ